MNNEDPIVIYSMNEEDEGSVIGYMCLIDWECELGAASGGNRIYPSIENCKKWRKRVEGCGIVEVEVRFRSLVQKPKEYE